MKKEVTGMMLGACEIACRYPELTVEDAVGDVRQLSEMIREHGIDDPHEEKAVLTAACWFISADRNLVPKEAIDKALRLWNAFEEDEEENFSEGACQYAARELT